MAEKRTIHQIYQESPLSSLTGDEEFVLYNPLAVGNNKTYGGKINDIHTYLTDTNPIIPNSRVTIGGAGSGADYECTGSNDVSQLQAALDTGKAVEALDYTFIIDGAIALPDQCILIGAGRGRTVFDTRSGATNLRAFLGTGTDNLDFYFSGFSMIGDYVPGTGITFATSGQIGILVSNARKVTVRDCYFEGYLDATIFGNKLTSPYDDSLAAGNIKEIIFSENYCYECVGGLQGHAQQNIIWIGNHFRKMADDCCALLGAQNIDSFCKNALIIGNVFEDGRYLNANGVNALGVLAKIDGGGFGSETVQNVIIADNVIEDAFVGVYLANCSRITVANNIIDTSYHSAVYLIGGNEKTFIQGNTVIEANTANSASHAGILSVDAENLRISGNNIFGSATGFKQGVDVEGTFTNAIIDNNQIDSVSFYGIYAETGTNATVHDNFLTGTMVGGIHVGGANISVDNNSFLATFSGSKLALGTVSNMNFGFNNGLNPKFCYAQGNVTGATTFNRLNGNVIIATLTGNITVTMTAGAVAGDTLTLILTQDGTGSRLVTWPSNFKKAGGTLTLSTAASAVDIIEMVWDGTNWREVSRSLNLS